MNNNFKPEITVFHCTNVMGEGVSSTLSGDNPGVKSIRLPCSSMVKDVFILRAFESGADAVVVLTCPEEECHYVDGSIRARKRVERLKTLLNEIGLGSHRLSLFNVSPGDEAAVNQIIQNTVSDLASMEVYPATQTGDAPIASG